MPVVIFTDTVPYNRFSIFMGLGLKSKNEYNLLERIRAGKHLFWQDIYDIRYILQFSPTLTDNEEELLKQAIEKIKNDNPRSFERINENAPQVKWGIGGVLV